MSVNRFAKFVLTFFIYSFIGWIWESTYKSIRQKKFINRGFLNGPWLPIYGFGALMILAVTFPVRQNNGLIFLLGMLSASLFEFLVGAAMEKIFHARYWDYSRLPLNVKGYISLPVSILWGVFSLILVHVIDVPISRLIAAIPPFLLYLMDILFCIFFVLDTIFSIVQALDLKKVLKNKEALMEEKKAVVGFEQIISAKALRKAEKITKRNPNIHSIKHQLNHTEIKNILTDLKNKKE